MEISYRHLVQIENLSRTPCARSSTEIFTREVAESDLVSIFFLYQGRSGLASLQPLMILGPLYRILTAHCLGTLAGMMYVYQRVFRGAQIAAWKELQSVRDACAAEVGKCGQSWVVSSLGFRRQKPGLDHAKQRCKQPKWGEHKVYRYYMELL